jgi:hypothetical protein
MLPTGCYGSFESGGRPFFERKDSGPHCSAAFLTVGAFDVQQPM